MLQNIIIVIEINRTRVEEYRYLHGSGSPTENETYILINGENNITLFKDKTVLIKHYF